jgi:hypothetical protein
MTRRLSRRARRRSNGIGAIAWGGCAQSATDVLVPALLGAPVICVHSASELIARSFPQTNEAIGRLVDAGV